MHDADDDDNDGERSMKSERIVYQAVLKFLLIILHVPRLCLHVAVVRIVAVTSPIRRKRG